MRDSREQRDGGPAVTLATPHDIDEDSGARDDEPAVEDLVEREILVEDVSIDGMCGVY